MNEANTALASAREIALQGMGVACSDGDDWKGDPSVTPGIQGAPTGASLPGFRVLVSSPDPLVSDFLTAGLSGGKFEVLSCQPEWDMVEAVVEQSPDLLVLDIAGNTGTHATAVRILRKVRPSLRIIVLSASSCSQDGEIISEGVFYYTIKPAGADLIEVIQAAAARRS